MSLLMTNNISRWWRGRGFGVHSPFAFKFITATLHCPHAYYAYGAIADEARTQREQEDAERLFRIVLHFRPRSIERRGVLSPAMETAVAEASAAFRVASERRLTIVAEPQSAVALEPDTVTVFVGHGCELAKQLSVNPEYGMIFRGRRMVVAVMSTALPFQQFDVDI